MAVSYPVWVGSLTVDVKENLLYDLFSKFGPIQNTVILRDDSGRSKQCGFVNFLSQDAAETAAARMDGNVLMGHAIKTLGPSGLLASGKSASSLHSASGNKEKKDYRCLIDCVFFVEGRECSPKNGECPYRHSVAARRIDVVCDKWLLKQCVNVLCPRRHPKLIKQQPDIQTQFLASRCPSHNAFKCTGECGFDDCNTHFMEKDALHEHINRGREKKLSPSSSCSRCKAIFFTKDERRQHSCLSAAKKDVSLDSQPETGDAHKYTQPRNYQVIRDGPVKFTNSPVLNLLKPQHVYQKRSTDGHPFQCSSLPHPSAGTGDFSWGKADHSSRFKGSLCSCSSCGKVYENSGDSLSDFDLSADIIGISGHKCPNSPSVRGYIGDSELLSSKNSVTGSPLQGAAEPEPIGVFWDIENCPVPRGKSASAVVQKIRKEFFAGKREVEFMCVCDISKEKKEVVEELNKAQVTVVHINATSKNAADDKLRQSLRRFAQSYPAPATVILVSGDINFAAELSDLRHRHNLEVICLHNAQAQSALLACAHQARRFDRFTASLPAVLPPKLPEENGLSSELLVLNLPVGKDVALVKNRLKKLSDNCGGKVVSISGRTSVLRFPNPASAARARRRMDKEDVFGSTIQVVYSSSRENGSPQKGKKSQQQDDSDEAVDKNAKSLDESVINLLKKDKNGTGPLPQMSKTKDSSTAKKTDKGFVSKLGEDSTDSADSTEENEKIPTDPTQGSSFTGSTGPPFISHQTMFSNGSYTGIWPHPIYQNIMNLPTQGSGFPGITPLAPPMMGAPHLAASWLASLHNFTVLDQQRGGIDLLVTNLDESVGKKELKKKLASVFREHCKVYSVILHSGEGIPLRAFVKVPKLSDAHLAICKVHQKKIFNSFVSVTIATDKEKDLCFLRCEVTSILKEAPLHFMPLNKFLNDFYEKCSHPFDMSSVGLMHDLVVITGKPGNQAISLVTRVVCRVKVNVDLHQFSKDVHALLKSCDGAIPLVSFAASYWLKFDKKLELNENGSALAEVLSSVPNVKISESLMVTWVTQAIKDGGKVSKLLELGQELKELMNAQEEYELPLSTVISEYQMFLGKKAPFDPVVYGFNSVVDLLGTFPSIVEIFQQGAEKWLTLTQSLKVKAFEKDLKALLESQPDGCIALGNFVSVYMKFFGRKCKIATFGFSKLTELMEAVPQVAKIQGSGDQRYICLVEKEKSPKSEKRSEKVVLARELRELLASSEGQRIPVSIVLARYYQHFARILKLADYGVRRIEELVESLQSLQITEISGEKFLTLTPKVTMHTLRKDLLTLLELQEGKFVLLSRLPAVFRKHFDRKFPLVQPKLEEFIRSQGEAIKVKGAGSDKILCIPLGSVNEETPPKLKSLANQITTVLMKYPGCRVAKLAFANIFARFHGQAIIPKEWGFGNMDALISGLSEVIEVLGSGNLAAVCVKQEFLLKTFSEDVVTILSEFPDKCLPLFKFITAYEKRFRQVLRVENFGFVRLEHLFGAISSVAKFVEGESKIRLTPLQQFAIETRDLLNQLGGAVSLNRFAPNFQQSYNRPCKAADYGFNRISEVLDAVSNVAEIRGKGAEKMVVLVDGDDVVLFKRKVAETPKFEQTVDEPDGRNERPGGSESDATSCVTTEEDEERMFSSEDNEGQDLIVLDGEAPRACPELSVADDWLMAPVPETLPEPELRPAIPEPVPVGDLISFTEFDTDVLFAAIESQGLPAPLQSDLSEFLAESNELSGEFNCSTFSGSDCRLTPKEVRSSSLAAADLIELDFSFMSPSPVKLDHVAGLTSLSPSPRLAGVMLHSEVEADILSNSHPQSDVSRKLEAAFNDESVKKQPLERKSPDQEARPKLRKFSIPKVKLAANFTAMKSKK